MSQKFRSIWLYAVIVFGMAILLIFVSTVSLTKLPPDTEQSDSAALEQKQFNQTIQQSLSEMTAQSNELRQQLNQLEKEAASLQEENAALQAQQTKSTDANNALFRAMDDYMKQQYASSRDRLQTIQTDALSEQGAQLYETLKKQLNNKGYRF